MKRLTKAQRQELDEYVRHYTERGVMGMWWDLAMAIKTACAEIDGHRTQKKLRTLILFEDYHNDGMDRYVEATKEEWETLIKPCGAYIDSATVDHNLFNQLFKRTKIKPTKQDKVIGTVPLV